MCTRMFKVTSNRNFSVIFCNRQFDSGAISHQNLSDGKRFTGDSARARHKMSLMMCEGGGGKIETLCDKCDDDKRYRLAAIFIMRCRLHSDRLGLFVTLKRSLLNTLDHIYSLTNLLHIFNVSKFI